MNAALRIFIDPEVSQPSLRLSCGLFDTVAHVLMLMAMTVRHEVR